MCKLLSEDASSMIINSKFVNVWVKILSMASAKNLAPLYTDIKTVIFGVLLTNILKYFLILFTAMFKRIV